jgi:hypothetical protein
MMMKRMFKAAAVVAVPRRVNRLLSTVTIADNIMTTATGDLPVTTTLHIQNTAENAKIPVFRMMNASGKLLDGVAEPPMTEELATKMYQHMVRVQSLDDMYVSSSLFAARCSLSTDLFPCCV